MRDEHGVNIENEVNDSMEEDDNNKIVEHYRTNRLIQDAFAWVDQDNFHDIHGVPLLVNENKLLYEISREKILSATFLLVTFKVFNGFSNTFMT